MTILSKKLKESEIIIILKRYGKLLLKKHHQREKRKYLNKIKKLAIELIQ